MADGFDPRRLLESLNAGGVDYVVIGGIAARLFGGTRVTEDLDICYSTEAANLKALGKVLTELNARLKGVEDDVPFVPDERTLSRTQVLTLETDDGGLDVLARPSGAPPYRELRRRAEVVDIESTTVRIASLDDLIAMKEAAGRDKDLLDAKELRKLRRLGRRVGT